VGSHDRGEGRICAEEGESIPVVKRGIRGGKGVCKRIAKKGIYLAVKVTTNSIGILCGKEG